MGVAACVALALAVRAPLTLTVLGLVAFGLLHNVLEIRYVAGRFAALLTGRFLGLLLALTTGIALCRLTAQAWPNGARLAEVGLGYVVLAFGCAVGLRGWWLLLALATLAVAAYASLSYPAFHFVVLTHLHNLVPLFFLWDWARKISSPRGRLAFRLAQVGWILAVPAMILLGAADRWISADPGVAERFVGDGARIVAATAPPDSAAQMGLRFLVMFAFMQTMHYAVWVGFLPRYAPEAAAAFEARAPWLRGGRAWALGLAAGGFLALLFLTDYFQGRAVYGAVATYHAYLEFPVLLALLMSPRRVEPARLPPAGRATRG